jgi:ABC transporter substrate-binding protein (ThiB subfamily)
MCYLTVRWPVLPALLALLCAAYVGAEPAAESEPEVLTVMGHDSTVIPEEVLAEFEERYGARVSILLAGDAGSALNRAILATGNPLADVLYGVDNAFLSRALEEGVFEAYEPATLADIAAELRLDASGHATPIDFGDVCVNYDITWFDEAGLEPPQTLEDLADPAYVDLLVVENPAASSPGLAFLLATIGRFGDPGYLDFWRELRANGVRVAPDWETAYFAEFSGGTSSGDRPLVVSYGSSPPVRGDLRRDPDRGTYDRGDGRRRELLPADRIRRHPGGHAAPRAGRALDRLHARRQLPGGDAAQHVRIPGPGRGAAGARVRAVPVDSRAHRAGRSGRHCRAPRTVGPGVARSDGALSAGLKQAGGGRDEDGP